MKRNSKFILKKTGQVLIMHMSGFKNNLLNILIIPMSEYQSPREMPIPLAVLTRLAFSVTNLFF